MEENPNIKEIVAPVKFLPFKNNTRKVQLGLKNNKPRALKQKKRNYVIKINANYI